MKDMETQDTKCGLFFDQKIYILLLYLRCYTVHVRGIQCDETQDNKIIEK